MVTGTHPRPAPPRFELVGGALPLDFVNSQDRSLGKPWVERLRDYDDWLAWSAQSASLPPARLRRLAREARTRPAAAARALERARGLREACFRIFTALERGEQAPPADLEALNRELARGLGRARLAPDAGRLAWGWDPDPRELEAPLWPVLRATAELLASPERAHVRRCASATCLWYFLDRSKNHQRRWCDMKVCGNRAKVREHRRRRRTTRSALGSRGRTG